MEFQTRPDRIGRNFERGASFSRLIDLQNASRAMILRGGATMGADRHAA
jgi:hypothetical protein